MISYKSSEAIAPIRDHTKNSIALSSLIAKPFVLNLLIYQHLNAINILLIIIYQP